MFLNRVNKSYSRIISGLLILAILLLPIMGGYNLASASLMNDTDVNNMTCEPCVEKEIIQYSKDVFNIETVQVTDSEKEMYLKVLESSDVFKNNSFAFGENIEAIRVMPLDIVQAMVNLEGLDNQLLVAFIDGKTDQVISLVHQEWTGLNNNDNVTLTKYLENGHKDVTEYTWKEVYQLEKANQKELKDFISEKKDKELKKIMTDKDVSLVQIQAASDYWEKFACAFSGANACGVGCLVFYNPSDLNRYSTCVSMCGILWSTGVC